MYDVIVAGAGPAGCHAAEKLAGSGYDVLVIEKKPGPGGKLACTGIISRECVDVFGIDKSVILHDVNSARLHSPSGIMLRVRREETQACIVDRDAFDKSMAARAERAGAAFCFNTRVSSLAPGKDGISVSCIEDGAHVSYRAKAAVLACGYSPNFAKGLGLGKYRYAVTGVQADVEAPDVSEVEVYFGDVSPKFFGWIVPSFPGRARVGLLARRDAGPLLKRWLGELTRRGRISGPDVPLHYGRIPLRPLKKTYGDRFIVTGDAAGQVKPLTGGGIYYGLIGAELAAGCLHNALHNGDLSAGSLAAYQKAWHEKLAKEINTGRLGRRVFEMLGSRSIDRLFTAAGRYGILETLLADPALSFDLHGGALRRLVRYLPGILLRVLSDRGPSPGSLTGGSQ